MRCGRCQAENREGRRFCAGCGAPLEALCPACGFANQQGERFCGGCGAELGGSAAAASAPARAPAPAPAEPAGERRQVTVLNVDIAGYSELSRRLGAEATHALLERFFAVTDGLVESHGGSIDKHIGDAVMARFGAPVAHSNDPERAVRCALAIHAAMADLSRELGRPLKVHVGIASGLVVASGVGSAAHREYTVTGETVNLAARLDDMAQAGETLVTDAVQRAVSQLAHCEPLGEAEVKGWDQPIRVWRLKGLRGEAPAARTPFVGRRAELGQIAGMLAACRESRQGQVVFVRGEAGIGKTRLVEEFAAGAARQGFATHRALVLDFGVGSGQDAIRQLARSLLGLGGGTEQPERETAARDALATGLVAPDREVFLNDLLDLPQPAALRGLYDAMDNATRNRGKQEVMAALVRAASARQPVLLAVEDLHWAAPATLAHLATIAGALRDGPAILCLTSRVVGDPIDASWRTSARGASIATIDLAPLGHDEALALAGGLIDAGNRRALRCIERAEGNPLFLEQLLRNAEESGDEDVPASIQSLVLARMDRLPPIDKRALQAASVIGQRFSLELMRHLVDDSGYACTRLIEHFLVRRDGTDYLFDHALIRDGAYSSLLNADKRRLHRRAAEWFETRDPVLCAEHLDAAGDPEAAERYLAAAEMQAAQFHFERARQLVERGLALAGERAVRYRLTSLRGDLLRDLGESELSVAAFRDALELADGDTERCHAQIGLVAGLRVLDRYDEALAVLDEAEAAAHRAKLSSELAQIHYYRGNIFFPMGRIEGCRDQHALALQWAHLTGSVKAEARALSGLGDAEYLRGRMATACDLFRRCVALCRKHGFGRIAVPNAAMVGFTRHYLLEAAEAVADGEAALEAAARVGHHRAEMMANFLIGLVLIDKGEPVLARASVERSQALARRLGARRFEAQNLLFFAMCDRLERRTDRLGKLLGEARDISREVGDGFVGPRIMSELAFHAGNGAERRRLLAEGEAMLAAGSVSHNHLWFHRSAIEASLLAGDWDEAERYAAALAAYTAAEPLPWSDIFIALGQAGARAGRRPDDAAARAELERLAAVAEGAGLRSALPPMRAMLAQAA